MRKGAYFKLYSYCLPVMGKRGAAIIDLHRVSYTTIPQFLCEILQDYDNVDIPALKTLYNDEGNNIEDYFGHLCNKMLGFFTDEPERYPRMSLEWDSPEVIKYGVLQIEDYDRFDYRDVLLQLDQLLCKNMEVWFTGSYTAQQLNDFLSATHGSLLRSVAFVLKYNPAISLDEYKALVSDHKKLGQVYLYCAPEKIQMPESKVYGVTGDLGDKKALKNISRDEYIILMEFFTESQRYNPYYNKKLCIDANGFVRNSLTDERHFGNIQDTPLASVADDPAFRELWYACNDKIADIQDSEFRYIWLNTHDLVKTDSGYSMIDQ